MARSQNQKLKILYLMDFLLRESDENHPVSVRQMIAHLESRGISAERKSIYDDLEALRFYGLDIVQSGEGKAAGYYAGERDFELPELKLLVDSVQSSKFITHKKSAALIRKIEGLTSVHEARNLNRQVYVQNRVKTMNESIYYNVDDIHTGIAENRKIRFRYFEYNVARERQFRRNGAWYVISPYGLSWDNENYYMVGYDSEAGKMKHYRVDKMTNITVTEEARDGAEVYEKLDMAEYARRVFGMFSGEVRPVKLRFENYLVGAVIDRFGKDVMVVPDGDDHFTVQVEVAVSPPFFGWVFGFGASARILGPADVVERMKEHVRLVAAAYEEGNV